MRILRWRGAARENQRDPGASRHGIGELDAAVVLVDDLFHDGKAEARALGLRRDVGFERAMQHGIGEAGARVGNREPEFVAAQAPELKAGNVAAQ